MRGYQYPKCCKIYNINDFDYDNASWNRPPYRAADYNNQKKKREEYERKFGNYYQNVLVTAAVTCRQMVAKKALEDRGFELVQEINNKEGDGIVYFYKKLLQREPNGWGGSW